MWWIAWYLWDFEDMFHDSVVFSRYCCGFVRRTHVVWGSTNSDVLSGGGWGGGLGH